MTRKKVAKKAALRETAPHGQKSNGHVSLLVKLHVMGAETRRKLEKIIADSLEKFGGQVVDRQTYSLGCYGRGVTWDARFPRRSVANTVAATIYLHVHDVACVTLSLYVDGEWLEMDDAECNTAGTTEMILALVDKYFDEYIESGGNLGRRAFLSRCLGSSGGVERLYVEEGLTPSWQQLGAWYYELP